MNLNLQTLADVLDNKILVHIHCYRADDMLQQIKLSREFGYKIRSFHHAVEATKQRHFGCRGHLCQYVGRLVGL